MVYVISLCHFLSISCFLLFLISYLFIVFRMRPALAGPIVISTPCDRSLCCHIAPNMITLCYVTVQCVCMQMPINTLC